MTAIAPAGATIPGVTHHLAEVNGTRLHYVEAGSTGSPILLVHGWPETWWAFRGLIPLLAATHRVVAVDLRGFGDSSAADGAYDDVTSAEDLRHLVGHLGAGPVHVLCQDISGGLGFRLAATHPAAVRSLTVVETTLAGFGFEGLADVAHGGFWHVGFLGAPGIPELLLAGHERRFLAGYAYPAMTATPGAVTDADLDEFTRTYARPGGWRGTAGLYRSALAGADATRALAASHPVAVPVLTVDAGRPSGTARTFAQVARGGITSIGVADAGHLVAQEAPAALAAALLDFTGRVDHESGRVDHESGRADRGSGRADRGSGRVDHESGRADRGSGRVDHEPGRA